MFVELTKSLLETVKPSHRSNQSRSRLADASSSMSNAINLNNADEKVDLSQRSSGNESSSCC